MTRASFHDRSLSLCASPDYAGVIPFFLGAPLLVGSWYGLALVPRGGFKEVRTQIALVDSLGSAPLTQSSDAEAVGVARRLA